MTHTTVPRTPAASRTGRDVRRPRVVGLLDAAVQRAPVVEVVAPAGAGKSTAVAQWAAGRPGVRVVDGGTPDLTASPRPAAGLLVVDDAHRAARADVAALVGDALTGRTGGLVLVGRADLLAETHRLRLTGDLAAVRAADLAFTAAEVRALAGAEVGPVGEEAAQRVVALTGGWPVAVRLALLAVAGDRDPSGALLRLGHDDLAADGYLLEQVLDRLDPRLRTFVLRATVDDVVDAPLAERLLDGGAALLDECVRLRLFLEPSGRASPVQRYRWNPVVAAGVRAIAGRREPATVAHLHRRAALHLARCAPDVAFEHALRAGDPALARDVLVQQWPDLVVAARAGAAAALAARLPAPADVDADVRLVRDVGAPARTARSALVELLVAPTRVVPPGTRGAARAALGAVGPGGPGPAATLLVRYVLARSDPAVPPADDAVTQTLWHVAAQAGAGGLPRLRAACLVEVALREVGTGPAEATVRAAAAAVDDVDDAGPLHVPLDLALGLHALWQLRTDRAGAHLRRAHDTRAAAGHADARRAAEVGLALLAALAHGVTPPAGDTVPPGPWAPVLALLRGALGVPDGARPPGARPDVVAPTTVGALLRDAVRAADAGRPAAAHELLEDAFEHAAPDETLLPLVPSSTPVRALLVAHLGWGTRHAPLVRRVLDVRGAGGPSRPVPALTAREGEVLVCLRAGMSSTEIAAALVLSVNTVKTHQRGLYRKLGVVDRREAVRQGLARGLLP